MAVQHRPIDRSTPYGSAMFLLITQLRTTRDGLRHMQGVAQACVDFDPDPDDFSTLATRFGLASAADAAAFKAEFDSVMAKLEATGSTSEVKQAIDQFVTFFG